MSIPYPWLLGFGITALLLVLGATSGLVNSKLWVSEPLVCAAFGVAVGPLGAGQLRLDASVDVQAHEFLREAARVTLAIACWPRRSGCRGGGSGRIGEGSPSRSGRGCC